MLRRTIIGSLVVAAALITPVLASADTTHDVTVVSALNLPSGWGLSTTSTFCGSSDTVDSTGVGVTGPAKPPLGTGSLSISVPSGEVADLIYTFPADVDSALTATTLYWYPFPVTGADTPITATAHLYLHQGASHYYDLSGSLVDFASTWQSINLWGLSTWNAGTGAFGSPPETPVAAGNGSYPQFLLAASAATLGELDIDLNNCEGKLAQKYAIDSVLTGITTGTSPHTTTTNTTVNFEARPPTVLTPHVSASTITAGHTVTPSVTASVKSQADNSGHDVTLSEKTAGSSTYKKVVTRTTDKAGDATAPAQKLTRTTTYRWTYVPLPGSIFAAGTSKTVTVTVAPKVTLHLAKTVIGKHGSLHASGLVKPSSGPATITLRAKKSGHTITATGHESAKGSYTITKHLPAGRYRVSVRVGKDATNGAGTSKQVTVIVN
jgi:hypothetical protein